ncbi:MAG: hypothetical protein NTZ05_11780 [Chloroflexi bacterium]|nr:hypothetical protein [Chloroflexota bacterium]
MMTSDNLSPHPTDRLMRDLITTGRAATPEDVRQIIERMATAPFDQRVLSVDGPLRGKLFQGSRIGFQEDSVRLHLMRRVLVDYRWTDTTSVEQYLSDMRNAVRHSTSRLAVYRRRGGSMALIVTPTHEVLALERRSEKSLGLLAVLHSADRGIMVSGYQISGLSELALPEDIQWLK